MISKIYMKYLLNLVISLSSSTSLNLWEVSIEKATVKRENQVQNLVVAKKSEVKAMYKSQNLSCDRAMNLIVQDYYR